MPNRRAGFSRGRRWGQNFPVNPGAADRIIEAFRPGPSDLVLEVGPGRGVLTRRSAVPPTAVTYGEAAGYCAP